MELSISGIDLWIPLRDFVDPAQSDRAVEALRLTIELAEEMGGVPVSTILPDAEDASAVVETVAETADLRGVRIADLALDHLDDSIGVGVDPALALSHDRDPTKLVLDAGANLVSARLCDMTHSGVRGPIGESHDGRLDVLSYRVALMTVGQSTAIVIDPRQWVDPWRGIDQSIAVWRSATTI